MMKRLTGSIIIIVTALMMVQAASKADELTAKHVDEIHNIISDQLTAFINEDATRAYSYAAPLVKLRFPTADLFMNMVEKGYGAIYRSTSHDFGRSLLAKENEFFQELIVTDEQGKTWQSVYVMQKLSKGDWKIKSVHIRPSVGATL